MWIGKCNMDIFWHKENIVASIKSEKWRYILKGHSVVLEEEEKKKFKQFFSQNLWGNYTNSEICILPLVNRVAVPTAT